MPPPERIMPDKRREIAEREARREAEQDVTPSEDSDG